MAPPFKYSQYPTPPPTSSPKYKDKDDSYNSRPAQETYFEQPTTTTSYSRPASANHWDTQLSNQYTTTPVVLYQQPQNYLPAFHRQPQVQKSLQAQQNSMIQVSNSDYYTRPASPLPQKVRPQAQTYNPPRRRSFSPPKNNRHSPRPLYYSPANPIPSPYNASRPKPRPGFVQRMLAKIERWIRSCMRWCKRNPITAGLLTFIPVVAGAGLVRAVKSLKIGDMSKKMGAGQTKKTATQKQWDWGLDQFAGFGGSKGGPLEGMIKILQMGEPLLQADVFSSSPTGEHHLGTLLS
ncbi:uncharacterized protein RAG0_13602 [Rhynchosporium agropyri]|uniref:Uncharacterized protein n=1 Tax=Rhynchosporium agropyri TaxID=914238 RepID=A0A1E1LDP1_9HELO|nr:uncharacterized protein RAG0_13602 [Rhynchosporium agropyri]